MKFGHVKKKVQRFYFLEASSLFGEILIQLYGHGLKGWLSEAELILLLSGPASLSILLNTLLVTGLNPSEVAAEPLSGLWCWECQTIVRNFENPFSFRFRFVNVFADISCLRWNVSASVPGQLKLYSMLRAFTRKFLLVGKSNQPRFSYRSVYFSCIFVCLGK